MTLKEMATNRKKSDHYALEKPERVSKIEAEEEPWLGLYGDSASKFEGSKLDKTNLIFERWHGERTCMAKSEWLFYPSTGKLFTHTYFRGKIIISLLRAAAAHVLWRHILLKRSLHTSMQRNRYGYCWKPFLIAMKLPSEEIVSTVVLAEKYEPCSSGCEKVRSMPQDCCGKISPYVLGKPKATHGSPYLLQITS